MAVEIKIVEEAPKQLGMNPKKFATWLFLVSIGMLFAALTSAYLVRQAEGNWMIFDLPSLFTVNTVVILLSSLTMHGAVTAARKDKHEMVKVWLGTTLALGVAFLIGQWMAFVQLVDQHVNLVGLNASGVSASFLYLITGLHGAHIIGGVVFLCIVLVSAYKLKVHSGNMLRLEMCATYWHFLDGLWLYLFVFLLLNR
jgi:cytochrome c oxidase subunit 3